MHAVHLLHARVAREVVPHTSVAWSPHCCNGQAVILIDGVAKITHLQKRSALTIY